MHDVPGVMMRVFAVVLVLAVLSGRSQFLNIS